MAEASGISRDTLLSALDSTVIASKFLSYEGGALKNRDHAPTFTTADMAKDMTLATGQGDAAASRCR